MKYLLMTILVLFSDMMKYLLTILLESINKCKYW